MILFCFPIAGGSITFFNQLKKYLEPEITVVELEYSGHGKRHKESFYNDFDELANDLYEKVFQYIKVNQILNKDYAFMGYSMGSIAAVEVLKKIIAKGELAMPCHVFLAAHEPKTKAEIRTFHPLELDEIVRRRTIKFGLPEELIDNKSFWRLYLPIYRADYNLIRKYDFDLLDLKTEISATIFYSETDTPYSSMKVWGNYFIGKSEFICYEGGHFFIRKYGKEMADVIKSKCAAPHIDKSAYIG